MDEEPPFGALLHTRNDDERHGPGLGHAEPSLCVDMTANVHRLGEAPGARSEDLHGHQSRKFNRSA